MPAKKQELLNNPSFNNFIYTILYNADYKHKKGLEGKFMRAATNEKAAKKFAAYASKEDKEFIMSHLGFEFFYIVAKRGMTFSSMKEEMRRFEFGSKKFSMQALAESGIFVMGDKEFLKLSGLTELKVHHPNFSLNLELARQGYNINNWSKRNLNDKDLRSGEIHEGGRRLSRMVRASKRAYTVLKNVEKVSNDGMDVLLYLYESETEYVRDEDIHANCHSEMKKIIYRHLMQKLKDDGYIRNTISDRQKKYTITGLGIKRANQFLIEVAEKTY